MTEERFHPIANVFDILPEKELSALAEDIKANGLRHFIVIYEDLILDGRNRFLACQRAGVEAKFTEFTGDRDAAIRFVVSENLHRRHLTDHDRTMVATRIANLMQGQRADKQHQTQEGPIGPSSNVTTQQAADALNVSARNVKRARRAQEHGVPELVEAMEKGEVTIAAAEAVATLPPDRQREAVNAGPAAVKQAAREARTTPKPRQLTAAQEELARRRRAHQLLQNLVALVTATKQAANDVVDGDAVAIVIEDSDMVRNVAAELRSVADWLEALVATPAKEDA